METQLKDTYVKYILTSGCFKTNLSLNRKKIKEIEAFFDKEYTKLGDQQYRSQSEWGRIAKFTKPCASENCNMLIPDDKDFCQFHCENLPF